MVSNIEVRIPKKPPTPNNIGEDLSSPQRQFWKESLFVQYDKNKNPSLKENKSSVLSLLLVLRKVDVMMHENLLHATVQIGVPRLKVLILINHTVQWHMLTHSK